MQRREAVCKGTGPNGKIHAGSGRTESIGYFGSPHPLRLEASRDLRRMSVRREIARDPGRGRKSRSIPALRAGDPGIGYNPVPEIRP